MPVNPPFRWNAAAAQYVRANGRFVPRSDVRRAIDAALLAEEKRARSLAEDLRNGRITLDAWRTEMRDLIKTVQTYGAAAAKGGWAQLTQSDYGRIGQIVRSEYGFLEQFAQGIASGRVSLASVQARAVQYALAGRDTYHQTERIAARDAGLTQERNILHPADHCDQCVAQTARKWVSIGQLIPIGRRTCRRYCRCSLAFR
jgi:hypothetical protein